jgi:hypothetical protein
MCSNNCCNQYISKQRIQEASASLNYALALDPKAISELVSVKVNCNRDLLEEHPTLCVQPELDSAGNEIYTVGVISLLNSVLATLGFSKICAIYTGEDAFPEDLDRFTPLCTIEEE